MIAHWKSAQLFASAGIRSRSRYMDRIPAPPMQKLLNKNMKQQFLALIKLAKKNPRYVFIITCRFAKKLVNSEGRFSS